MEQELKKRRRGNEEKEEELKNDSKKQRELIGFDSDYDFKFSDSSFQPLGVFDFPWLTEENQPINELLLPEELKFDDIFSSSLMIETSSETSLTEFSGSDESCHHHHRTPFLVEETTTTLGGGGGGGGNNKLEEEEEDEFYDRTSDSRNDDEINGVDCIWSSVLNQPLFTRSSGKLCHVTDA